MQWHYRAQLNCVNAIALVANHTNDSATNAVCGANWVQFRRFATGGRQCTNFTAAEASLCNPDADAGAPSRALLQRDGMTDRASALPQPVLFVVAKNI